MAGYNRIIMMGNLTRDPEYKQLPSGQGLCRLSLASNRQIKNRQTGATTQEVCFVDVDVWGAQAEPCRQYLSKGRPILVEGRLKLDTWQDAQGANRSKHCIVAERVMFLSAGAADNQSVTSNEIESSESASAESTASYSTQKTEEFMKVEQAVAKKQAARRASAAVPAKSEKAVEGSAEFKDEAPFDEELPF